MSTISSYPTSAFSESQKFIVLDPSTQTTALVLGSDLVSYISPNLDSVRTNTTRTAAMNEDYEVGTFVQTAGGTAIDDGGNGMFLVVGAGEGDYTMLNGNELLLLPFGSLSGSNLDGALVTDDGTATAIETVIAKRGVEYASMEALRGSTDSFDFVTVNAFYAGGTPVKIELYRDGTGTATSSGAANISAALAGGTFCNAAGVGYKIKTSDGEVPVGAFGVTGSGTETANIQHAVNASGALGVTIVWPAGSFTMGTIEVTDNCSMRFCETSITLSGTGAGFRVSDSFDYFVMRGKCTVTADGVEASLHKAVYASGSGVTVADGVIEDLTAVNCVTGIEASQFSRCWIVRPRILGTVGTTSGRGYGIVAAGNAENLFIIDPYCYRTTRHALYAGNVEKVQISNPIIEEHRYGVATYNYYSAIAISRNSDCCVTNPMFINCADEGIGIDDDDSTGASGFIENVVIVGGSSRNPQGAFRVLRIGTNGTPSADIGQRTISVLGLTFEANPDAAVDDVQYLFGSNVNLDLIVAGDNAYASGKSFINLVGNSSGNTDYINLKLRGALTGSSSLIPVALGSALCTGTASVIIDVEAINHTIPVNFGATPTNTRIMITSKDPTTGKALHVWCPVSAAGGTQMQVEGGKNGYGAGVAFVSRTSDNVAPTEMASITADGAAAWDGTAANMDADLNFYTRLNNVRTKQMNLTSSGAAYNVSGTWGTISDARLKENISDARGYLADLMRLRVVKYSLISRNMPEADMLGLLAQEVEQVFPGLVETDRHGFKHVKQSVLIYMLLKAVQEMNG